jgi:hypothetical protein
MKVADGNSYGFPYAYLGAQLYTVVDDVEDLEGEKISLMEAWYFWAWAVNQTSFWSGTPPLNQDAPMGTR